MTYGSYSATPPLGRSRPVTAVSRVPSSLDGAWPTHRIESAAGHRRAPECPQGRVPFRGWSLISVIREGADRIGSARYPRHSATVVLDRGANVPECGPEGTPMNLRPATLSHGRNRPDRLVRGLVAVVLPFLLLVSATGPLAGSAAAGGPPSPSHAPAAASRHVPKAIANAPAVTPGATPSGSPTPGSSAQHGLGAKLTPGLPKGVSKAVANRQRWLNRFSSPAR